MYMSFKLETDDKDENKIYFGRYSLLLIESYGIAPFFMFCFDRPQQITMAEQRRYIINTRKHNTLVVDWANNLAV